MACKYFTAPSCKGGTKNATAQCKEGFVGAACSVCDEGYYKFVGDCKKCEDGVSGKLINIVLVVCLVSLWVGINHFLSSTLESVDVFLAFSQMAAVIGRFDVQWPYGISSNGYVFRAANFLDFDVRACPSAPARTCIHTSTALTSATTALGLGQPLPQLGLGPPLPQLH